MPEYLVELLDDRLARRIVGRLQGRARIVGLIVAVDDHRKLNGFRSRYPIIIRRVRKAYLVVEG